jgi:hypothetical protein
MIRMMITSTPMTMPMMPRLSICRFPPFRIGLWRIR